MYHDIEWDVLFRNVKNIDILYIYGTTWNRVNREHIKNAIDRHAQIRVVVADPNDKLILSELARHLERSEEQIQANIEETIMYFQKLQKAGAKISIWHLRAVPVYSFFRFDDTAVFSLYSQRRGESFNGPAFLLEQGGIVVYEDNGVSGTTALSEREALCALVAALGRDEVRTVFLLSEYSLSRDASLIDVNYFIELCRQRGVSVVTRTQIYDFQDPVQVRLFRFVLEAGSFMVYARTTLAKRFKSTRQTAAEKGKE